MSARYWYDQESSERAVLEAVRTFQRSDRAMRDRMANSMDMGVTDVRALQILIAAERRGERCTARDLSAALGITTASTAKLLNRLEASGHLRRLPNSLDRRSVYIEATEHSHREVRERLGRMHERMSATVQKYSPEERTAISGFLADMTAIFDASGNEPPLTPAP